MKRKNQGYLSDFNEKNQGALSDFNEKKKSRSPF